ncbi:putative tol protein [Rosellinia necatrix]|uniref:Putative tol protein n=1 Tax=Rosellinia necatrix TaxID=77044 RepID=A0A1W2TI30_ROSNE|nr:putative tol protein [Rosellinia necatrix]
MHPWGVYGKEFPEPVKKEATKPQRRGLTRWLTPLFKNEAPSLCQVCLNRKLDFRPLIEEPPGAPYNDVDDYMLTELEEQKAVHINDFLLDEATANESKCSLCRLLLYCADKSLQRDWLLRMPCLCTIRPRYDWLTHDGVTGNVIHRYQVWVNIQPVEPDIVFDVTSTKKLRRVRKPRLIVPPQVNLRLLREWVRRCDEKHSHSGIPNTTGSRMQPILARGLFRVINTSTGSVEAPTSLPKFVALSYVWGPASEQSGYAPLESKPIAAHARTIRDAATVAKAIGFKWIWVDRICIDQTSQHEKTLLIPRMKDIFAAAQLTIVAGCGADAQVGLLGSPGTPRTTEKSILLGSSVALLPVSVSASRLIDDAFWSRRGWTFEEHIFSRRLLYVLESEVYFRCGTHTFRESMGCSPIGLNEGIVHRGIIGQRHRSYAVELHQSIQSKPANMSEVLNTDRFLSSVETYCNRDLMVEGDRVPAFAGVAIAALPAPIDEVSEQSLLGHGHPLHLFEILLTWQRGYSDRAKYLLPPDKPFAPSWSWASSPDGARYTRVRNQLLLNPDSWFQYTVLSNQDIVGIPTGSNSVDQLIGLKLPDELIADQPWMKGLSDNLPRGYEARPATDSRIYDSPSLPKLHLVTLVFDAQFLQLDEPHSLYKSAPRDTYVLTSLGSTETAHEVDRVLGMNFRDTWGLNSYLEPRYYACERASRPQPFETFAVITGRAFRPPPGGHAPGELRYDLWVMLLDPPGQHDTYTRVGLSRLQYLHEGSHNTKVIKEGRPRWQHICIA